VVCHVKGKVLNPYGKDLAAGMKALKTKKITPDVLKKVAKLDSDKDKASNEKELKAGTLPGDPKSKP
jgi:phosphoribosylformylglycinamidine (FGAM) synthase PurS component